MTARADNLPEAECTAHGECSACGTASDNAESKPDTRRGASKADPLTEAVRRAVDRCGLRGAALLVGYSGGGDSSALLHALHACREEYGITPVALHLNHCIRGEEADRDERHCRHFCREHGIALKVCRADVPAYAREHRLGLEEAARELRYACLREAAEEYGCSCIVTAHHANDELETMLFRLARGSALAGLGGIPEYSASRLSGDIPVLRPLLSVPRSEIERYIAENGTEYVTDSTNLEPCCARNVIRSRCVPALCELSPHAPEAAYRTARLLREDEALLSALAALPEDGLKRLTDLLGEYRTDTDGEYGTSKSAADTSGTAHSGAAQAGIGSSECPKTDRTLRNTDDPVQNTDDSIRNTYDSIQNTDPADSIVNTAAAAHSRSTDSISVPDRLPAPLLRRRLLSFYRDYCARRGISADPGSDNIEALARLCRVGATHEELSLPGSVRATKLRGGIMLSPDTERGRDRAPDSGDRQTRTTAANGGDYPEAAADGSASCGKTCDKTAGKTGNTTDDKTADKTCGRTDGDTAVEYPLRPGENRLPGGAILIVGESVTHSAASVSEPCGTTEGGAVKFRHPSGENIYNLSTHITVASAKLKGTLFARKRQPGDRVLVRGRHRTVKNLYQAAAVPPQERQTLPMICDGSGILWIPGTAVRDGALISPAAARADDGSDDGALIDLIYIAPTDR